MSRDAELYKDKIEVSLDGRQIFYLFFGGAVIVGLVFVLGVMVGRRVEARGHTDRARVAATVDPLAALDRLEGGSGLSFQGALRGADGPVSDVEKTIAAMPKHDDKKLEKAEPPKVDAVKVEKKIEEPKVEKKDEKAAEKKADQPKIDKAIEKPSDKAIEKPSDKAIEKPSDKKDEKVAEKADKPTEKTDKPAEKKDEAKEEKKTKFTLQLASFQDRPEALALLEAMKSAGYAPYLTEGSVDGKQYFRVRVGSYKTIEAANEARSELEKASKKSSIVIKL
jgi:cell division protein FtsN